jgi:RHS repeat-associated protein
VNYYYVRNLQGDVVGIYDNFGVVVVKYSYDAWGNVLDIWDVSGYNVGAINPIRYRGYYFDGETGYYYCQSRYYNPVWCRWISADVFLDTQDGILSTNMYAYCQNDSVNCVDPTGMATWWQKIGANSPNEIHNQVVYFYQSYFKSKGMTSYANRRINYNYGGHGFADLLTYDASTETAKVWEVKSRQTNGDKHVAAGKTQLDRYVNYGSWAERSKVKLQHGDRVPDFIFPYYNGKTYYMIYTHYEGEGVISYTYKWSVDPKKLFKEAAVDTALMATGVMVIGGIAAIIVGTGGAATPAVTEAIFAIWAAAA